MPSTAASAGVSRGNCSSSSDWMASDAGESGVGSAPGWAPEPSTAEPSLPGLEEGSAACLDDALPQQPSDPSSAVTRNPQRACNTGETPEYRMLGQLRRCGTRARLKT